MADKPKRFFGLGWVQVEGLRPADMEPQYAGKCYVNLDVAKMIQFPPDQPGVAIVTFLDGRSEAFEEGNHSRLLKAIEESRFD